MVEDKDDNANTKKMRYDNEDAWLLKLEELGGAMLSFGKDLNNKILNDKKVKFLNKHRMQQLRVC